MSGAALLGGNGQFGARVLQEIGDLGGPVVRIDRHPGHPGDGTGQLDDEILGPVFEQDRDAVAVTVAGSGEQGRECVDLAFDVRVRVRAPCRLIAALRISRNDQ